MFQWILKFRVRLETVNVNSSKRVFYPFSIKTSKCGGSCNNINGPYAKLFLSGVVKNINIRVFNLISRTNETRHVKWHENCRCKCRLDASVCNSKERWNKDNASVSVKNWSKKEYVAKDLFRILVIVNMKWQIMWCWRIFRWYKL